MSISIYPKSKVYIVAPANVATGGPELLHQLAYHLRKDLNIEAFMYYIPTNSPNPVHPAYKQYKNPYVKQIEDNEENLLIVPEIIDNMKVLQKYSKIRKVIWWLSVNNFYTSIVLNSKKKFFFRRTLNKIYRLLFGELFFDINDLEPEDIRISILDIPFIKQANYHFVQSFYALKHLENNNIEKNKIFYLSDYLNEEFLKIETDLSKKENIVAFNPKKGLSFTQKLIKRAPDIKFIPLINMNRQQVIETLQKAKVYIDFGNHPGKDRLPREAAILGCCVITGKRGSAKYAEDVPIPEEYKFENKSKNIPNIIEKIKDCFNNYEKRYNDFDFYRKVIKEEPKKFKEDLKKIFVKTVK